MSLVNDLSEKFCSIEAMFMRGLWGCGGGSWCMQCLSWI